MDSYKSESMHIERMLFVESPVQFIRFNLDVRYPCSPWKLEISILLGFSNTSSKANSCLMLFSAYPQALSTLEFVVWLLASLDSKRDILEISLSGMFNNIQ